MSNVIINCKGVEFTIKSVKKYSEEQENGLKYCFELLCKQKDKSFYINDGVLQLDNQSIFYEISNQILYYDDVEFYGFEIIDIKYHLMFMCVFDNYNLYTYNHQHHIINSNHDTSNGYKKVLLSLRVCHYGHSNNPNVYIENSTLYLPNSLEELEDFIFCYNILEQNNLTRHFNGHEMTYKGIPVGFNLRPYVQSFIDEIQKMNKLVQMSQ